jgi:hypothetical protein
LRYACYTAFPSGAFSHPDDNLTNEQLKRKVFGGDENLMGFQGVGGYY